MRPIQIIAPAIALAFTLVALPAEAQGKGNAKKKDKAESRVEQRAGDRYERLNRRASYGREAERRGNGAGKVPPGWCKGKGNPHNTPENCGYDWNRQYDRYDDRYDARRDRYPVGRSGSYHREHEDFHRYLDRKYSDLAARRPLDIQYQIRLRMEKSAEHDRWHERTGVRHR